MSTELQKITQLQWRKFLATPEGKEGLLVLREAAPLINGFGEQHTIVFSAGVTAGYAMAFDKINSLLATESKKEVKIDNE